jgi:hypothetical protein
LAPSGLETCAACRARYGGALRLPFEERFRVFAPKKSFSSTTLLDPKLYPAQELEKLYFRRWNVELHFGQIKCLDVFALPHPQERLLKELAMHRIASSTLCLGRSPPSWSRCAPNAALKGKSKNSLKNLEEHRIMVIMAAMVRQTTFPKLFNDTSYQSFHMTIKQILLKKLVRAQELSEKAVSAFDDPIMAVSTDGHVYFKNRKAEALLNKLNLQNRLPYLLEQLADPVLKGGKDWISRTFVNAINLNIDDGEHLFLPFIFGMRDEKGTLAGAVVVLHDLAKLRPHLGAFSQPTSAPQVVGLSERMRLVFSRN